MIIHDYDIETETLISPEAFYGPKKHLVDKCLIIFSKEIFDYLLANYECTQISQIGACNGFVPIYSFDCGGEQVAFYLTSIGSAIASDFCYETHWQTGATKFIMFGSCGSLDFETTKGRFIIPTEAYRGEGCSYLYAPPADYIAVKNADKLAAVFDEMGVPYVKGRVWTTDSMLRETVGLARRRRAEGCIAVEMEVAGVEAVCDFHGLELYDFLEAGDVLGESSYEMEGLKGANHNLGKLFIAMEVAKRI